MTGKELIEWIQNNKAEDLPVSVQYRDDGGSYCGEDGRIEPIIMEGEDSYATGFDIYEKTEDGYLEVVDTYTGRRILL